MRPEHKEQQSEWREIFETLKSAVAVGTEEWKFGSSREGGSYSGKNKPPPVQWGMVEDLLNDEDKEEAIKEALQQKILDKENRNAVEGSTLLHLVCEQQPPLSVVARMTSLYPGSLLETDVEGRTPLHCLISYGPPREDIVQHLVGEDVRVCTTQDLEGRTPMMLAMEEGYPLDIIETHLMDEEHQVLFMVTNEGISPLDAAAGARGSLSEMYTGLGRSLLGYDKAPYTALSRRLQQMQRRALARGAAAASEMEVRVRKKMKDLGASQDGRSEVEAEEILKCREHLINRLCPTNPDIQERSLIRPKTEDRGITLRQLRLVWDQIQMRCVPDGWKNHKNECLVPRNVTLYDVDRYIIRPATVRSKCSLVEALLTTEPSVQKPRFFVSHWWGQAVWDFMKCIEQHASDNELDENTTYWICAYANNQWYIEMAVADDPSQSSFRKAMEQAEGTISILDEGGVGLSRIWCCYELYVSLVDIKQTKKDYRWSLYTTKKESWTRCCFDVAFDVTEVTAVGFQEGSSCEEFPYDLAMKCLGFKLERGEASKSRDRDMILRSISGHTDVGKAPPKEHRAYSKTNTAVHGRLALVLLSAGVEPSQQQRCLAAISQSQMTFLSCNAKQMSSGDIFLQLIDSLPATLVQLKLENANDDAVLALVRARKRGELPCLGHIDLTPNNFDNDTKRNIATEFPGVGTIQLCQPFVKDFGKLFQEEWDRVMKMKRNAVMLLVWALAVLLLWALAVVYSGCRCGSCRSRSERYRRTRVRMILFGTIMATIFVGGVLVVLVSLVVRHIAYLGVVILLGLVVSIGTCKSN